MVKVNLIAVGNLKEKFLVDAKNEYVKRLSAFCDLKIIEMKESDRKKESLLLEKYLKGYNIALDLGGENLSSEEFSAKIDKITTNLSGEISFFIGGSDGMEKSLLEKMDMKLSFSKMTFPHQLFRVMLLEQIYRAFTILKGKAYHK